MSTVYPDSRAYQHTVDEPLECSFITADSRVLGLSQCQFNSGNNVAISPPFRELGLVRNIRAVPVFAQDPFAILSSQLRPSDLTKSGRRPIRKGKARPRNIHPDQH